jgi:hypothetical protein
MSHPHNARSVPGEIMASALPRHRSRPPPLDRVAGLTFLAKQASAPTARFSKPGGAAFWTMCIGLAAVAFWMFVGHSLVAGINKPQTLHSALTLIGVTSRVDTTGNNPILLIDGEAGNDGGTFAIVPPLEIRVASMDGSVTRYKLGTSSPTIGPVERFAFSSRLEVPKNGVKSVSVTFAE